jgi:hypothetical protein
MIDEAGHPVAHAPGPAAGGCSSGGRVRVLVVGAVTDLLLGYLVAVFIVAFAGLTAGASADPEALLIDAVPVWLAAHQVPLVLDGAPFGVLPLLPTILVAAMAAAVAGRCTRRLGGRWREDGVPATAALVVAHASAAVVASVLPTGVAESPVWAALLGGGGVAMSGAAPGAFRAAGTPMPAPLAAITTAVRAALIALTGVGAFVLGTALIIRLPDVHDRVESLPPGIGPRVGTLLLSLGYLPNAVVAALSWVAGPGLSIGSAAASPLVTSGATSPLLLPPLPLSAAFPVRPPPTWSLTVVGLPLVVGLLVGRICRRAGPDPIQRVVAAAAAATAAAACVGLAAGVISGRLAAGPFDPFVVPALPLTFCLVGWLGLPATLAAGSAGTSVRRWVRRPAVSSTRARTRQRGCARSRPGRVAGVVVPGRAAPVSETGATDGTAATNPRAVPATTPPEARESTDGGGWELDDQGEVRRPGGERVHPHDEATHDHGVLPDAG